MEIQLITITIAQPTRPVKNKTSTTRIAKINNKFVISKQIGNQTA